MATITMMQENVIAVPEKMQHMSNQITEVIGFVSELPRSTVMIQQISDGMEKLHAVIKDDELEKILQWISPLEPHKRHQDIRSKRLDNTGSWFLKRPEFEEWYAGDAMEGTVDPYLVCYGIPGAGKSVMSSLVIDHLSNIPCINGERVCVAYVYCDYQHEVRQTAINILSVLLKQILVSNPKHLSNELLDAPKTHKKKNVGLKINEICEFLKLALNSFDKFFICIDALDECKAEHRGDFLRSVSELSKHLESSARIFVTARPNMKVPIETALSTCPRSITLEANAEDIRKYVSYQLDMDVHHGDMDESFMQTIRDKVVEIADGMFLLPALQIQTVLEQNSISKRREALNTMPKKLDDAFQATIDRIRQQSLSKSTQGLEVLKWTFFAFKQLTIAELRHALAVNEYDTSADSLDLDKLPFEKSLTDCRHGLVVVDQETSSIRLVHKSLQDFLTKEHETDKLFINGHRENFSCLSDLFETQLQNNGLSS